MPRKKHFELKTLRRLHPRRSEIDWTDTYKGVPVDSEMDLLASKSFHSLQILYVAFLYLW